MDRAYILCGWGGAFIVLEDSLGATRRSLAHLSRFTWERCVVFLILMECFAHVEVAFAIGGPVRTLEWLSSMLGYWV